MKNIFLILALIAGCCCPAMSQSSSKVKEYKPGYTITLPKFRLDSIDLHKFALPQWNNKIPLVVQNTPRPNTNQPLDNMPCLQPQGNWPMPIKEADPSVKQTLLIKKN
jgi:hypothetical protein